MAQGHAPLFDLDRFPAPPSVTKEELESKLGRLRAVLERRGHDGILLIQEGAVRWLTGTRHQISDIAPDADSPVHACVRLRSGGVDVTFITTRIEMPRITDQLPGVFEDLPDVRIRFQESAPDFTNSTLLPGSAGYEDAVTEIVKPVLDDDDGNQVRKLEWLYAMASAVLVETALQLEPGMNGAHVRGLMLRNLSLRDIENNLALVALAGQEGHFHPLYNARYRVENGCWVKLVGGCRYAELIVSITVMALIGRRPSPRESAVYAALQQGAAEYADLFRAGAGESQIYAEVGERFQRIEDRTGLRGFQPSAYFHHMGGPTSPLGNRDYLLERTGTHRAFPRMQFAINPCDVLQKTKVELQGIVMPGGGPPRMLDGFRFAPQDAGLFTALHASGGTEANVSNVVVV